MKYNFDTIIDRYGTNSIKYDFAREKGKPQDLLPMWVADMDFTAPPEVLADIQQTVAHGIFGYSAPKSDYYNTVIEWFNNHFGYRVQRNEIVTLPGVVYGLAQAVRAFTLTGEEIGRASCRERV